MTSRTVVNLIATQIKTVVPGSVTVAPGWPTEAQLSNIARGTIQPIISIYDRGPAKNRTRWNKVLMTTLPPAAAGVSSSLNLSVIIVGGVVTLTLSGSVLLNDAVAAVFQKGQIQEGQVVVAGPTDTLTTLATSLANAVNGDSILSPWVTAVASGATVQFTNVTNQVVKISTATANQGTETLEFRRLMRDLQVILWIRDAQNREVVSEPVVTLLSQLSTSFGVQDPVSSQWVRLIYNGDMYVDDPVLNDLYRRDMFLYAEYGVTNTDGLYPVLVAKATLQPSVFPFGR